MNALLSVLVASTLGGAPEWKTVTPKGAGFQVAMPSPPTENVQTSRSPHGPIVIRIFSCSAKEGTYVAGVTEHPEAAVPAGQEQARLDQARDGAIQQTKGRLRSETKITVESRPGREILVATETGQSFKIRLIADRSRLFQVMVAGNQRFVESPEATRFLESFRFTK